MEEANGPYLLCWELETGKVTRIAGGPGNVKLRVGADGHLIARFSNRVCVYGPDLRDLASNPLLEIAGERRGAFPGFGSAGCVDADFVDGVLLVAAGNRVHRFSKAGRYLGEQRASGEVRSIASTGDVLALVALPSRGDIKLRLELHPLTSGAAKVSAARPQRPAARTSPTKRTKVDVVALRTMMKQLAALQPKGARPKPPTTKKELTALEKTLGQRVPDDLGALLEHCDGELRFGDFTFYRAKQIAKAHAMWTDLFAGEDEDEDEDEHGWNTAWTPFAGSSTGDVLCLTPQREVVLVFHADTRRPELAPSLSSLIQTVVKRLGSDKKRDPIYGYLKS
jgi:cell wall assembly regulator SMI1